MSGSALLALLRKHDLDELLVKIQDQAERGGQLVERFQSSNHMGCPKRPHSVDGKPKMQLSGFMESVV
jgi:hypothetical protein